MNDLNTEGTANRTGGPSWTDALSRRLWRLDADQLCAEARRRTGLKNFGDPPVEPVLALLVKSIEAEADLHPLGRFLMRAHLKELLETRLRLAATWRERANEISAQTIQRPIFITGMPRSGSTFLHEMIAQDPDNRSPRVWEVMFPVVRGGSPEKDQAARKRKAAMNLWWFRRLAPLADSVYPMRAETPHECVAIHSYTFLSEEFVSTCRIPTYETHLRQADLTATYAWEKQFLQHLQCGATPKRWVLKSPDHAHSLEELFAVFPDAVIIQTHRNPIEALKSSTQLTEVLRGLFARPDPRETIGVREARILAEGMERFIQFRDAHPELADRFIDVSYPELIADPLGIVRRIYGQLDLPLTDVAVERMKALAGGRTRYRGRRGATKLAEIGLDGEKVARWFERYCARFNVPCRSAEVR